jgi:Leucine-rich repeat (LRR) protein
MSSLSLGRNQIKDLAGLAKVTKLSTLDLIENQVTNLAPLAPQTELHLLMLDKNPLTDLTPLVNMAKADAEGPKRFAPYLRLYLIGVPLSEAAKTTQLNALKGFGVRIHTEAKPEK